MNRRCFCTDFCSCSAEKLPYVGQRICREEWMLENLSIEPSNLRSVLFGLYLPVNNTVCFNQQAWIQGMHSGHSGGESDQN